MEFEARLEEYRSRFENALDRWIPAPDTRPRVLHEAMNYSLRASGKRLRPVLLLAGNALFPSLADPMAAAVAIECLHTYSLIHDDLPSIDNSDLRRGQPTCHIEFGEATAILAGDALLTHAFTLLEGAYSNRPALSLALIRELGQAADSRRLIGGQMEDILCEDTPITDKQLDFIHLNKTAAVITAALMMGVRLTKASNGALDLTRSLGRKIGLAYQIVDDILDATGDTETLGKTAGADVVNRKNTYIRLHGLDFSRLRVRELTGSAVQICRRLGAESEFLISLVRSMEHRIC